MFVTDISFEKDGFRRRVEDAITLGIKLKKF